MKRGKIQVNLTVEEEEEPILPPKSKWNTTLIMSCQNWGALQGWTSMKKKKIKFYDQIDSIKQFHFLFSVKMEYKSLYQVLSNLRRFTRLHKSFLDQFQLKNQTWGVLQGLTSMDTILQWFRLNYVSWTWKFHILNHKEFQPLLAYNPKI